MNNSTSSAIECVEYNEETKALNTFLAVVLFIVAVYNSVVFLAMKKSHHLLRHNMVFMYVKSCLISSFMLSLFGCYQALNAVTRFESLWASASDGRYEQNIGSHRAIMRWSSLGTGVTLGLIMTSCAGITLLSYGISSTAYYATRHSLSKNLSPTHLIGITNKVKCQILGKTIEFNKKRLRAGVLIFAAWTIPCVAMIIAVWFSTCSKYCNCLPSFYPRGINGDKNCVNGNECSRLYIILTRKVTGGVAIIWMLLTLINYVNIATILVKFYAKEKLDNSNPEIYTYEQNTNINNNNDNNGGKDGIKQTVRKVRLPSALKIVIVIALSNTVSYIPITLLMVYDSLSTDGASPIANLIALALGGLYLIALPSILISYMAALRKSIIQTILSIKCFTSVTVTNSAKTSIPRRRKKNSRDDALGEDIEIQIEPAT